MSYLRDEAEIARRKSALAAAAFALVSAGGSADECLEAYEEGVFEALDMADANTRRVAEAQRLMDRFGAGGGQAAAA